MGARLPTLYIPHGGGPCFFIKPWPMGDPNMWDRLEGWLRDFPTTIGSKPRALVVISAHWEESIPTVMTGAAPPMLFDYYGFPPHTYELSWPAPGAPDVAADLAQRLESAGIETATDDERGFDHGVFVPLLIAYPDADVPTVQLSLRGDLDPTAHVEIGRALEPLRDDGVLLIGSGMSYHNMRAFQGSLDAKADSARFDAWLGDAVALPSEERNARLNSWADAPAARESHPREEHLLPLMVVAGAAGNDPGARVFSDELMGATVSAFRFG